MKKKYAFIILILGLILITGCGKKEKEVEYETKLAYFFYSYGNVNDGFSEYIMTLDDNEIKYISSGSVKNKPFIEKNIDISYFNQIESIIGINKVLEWDEFDSDDVKDTSKNTFTIQIDFDNGKSYNAMGCMNDPENFENVHNEFIKIFNVLNK